MPTIKSIQISPDAWVECYNISGLLSGTGLTIQNTGVGPIRYSVNTTQPLLAEKDLYPVIMLFDKVNIPAGTTSVWVIADNSNSYININKQNLDTVITEDMLNSVTSSGNCYLANFRVASLAAGASFYIGCTTGAKYAHLRSREIAQNGSTEISYRAAEDSVFTDGTALATYNRSRVSTNTLLTTFVTAPTVTSQGTLYLPKQLLLSSGSGTASRSGSDLRDIYVILKPNTKHIFTIQNDGTGTASPISWQLTISESSTPELPL